MKRKIIASLLLCSVVLTGCVSRSEFDELEARVSRLESNSGYYNNGDPNNQDAPAGQTDLTSYVKNWDEALTIIGQELGRTDFHIESITVSELEGNEATFKTFGNGRLMVDVEGILFQLPISDYVVQQVIYNNGGNWVYKDTPSRSTSNQ